MRVRAPTKRMTYDDMNYDEGKYNVSSLKNLKNLSGIPNYKDDEWGDDIDFFDR
jgi:hypothetical protein